MTRIDYLVTIATARLDSLITISRWTLGDRAGHCDVYVPPPHFRCTPLPVTQCNSLFNRALAYVVPDFSDGWAVVLNFSTAMPRAEL